MERQITNYLHKRVVLELSTGSQLMGTILWIQDDGSTFCISDSTLEFGDVVATRYVVRVKNAGGA